MLSKEHFPAYLSSIHHDGSARYVQAADDSQEMQLYWQLGDHVLLRLRSGRWAPVQRVLLRTCPDGEQQFSELQVQADEPACRWWQVRLHLSMPVTGYRFLIFTPDGAFWFNGHGIRRHVPTDAGDFRLLAGYQAPEWVRSSVFYQIFPDRFADGDPGNNVRDGEFEIRGWRSSAKAWNEAPSQGIQAMGDFYGGDLAGIQQRLGYLQELGVNAIYLNPIFSAYSNHRYDVVDYFRVDPHLGGDPALSALRQATTQAGIRLMLDIVPNHCGFLHPWFQAAQADLQAKTAEFFTFFNHPEDYASWLGVWTLPKLNYRSQALRQTMYAGSQAVFRHWLRPPFAVDGWRVDVANMLARQGAEQMGVEVSRGIRQAVKEENPQAYLLGENFFDASSQLQGDMWDASMNYSGFTKPLWYWLTQFEVRQHGEPAVVRAQGRWPTLALVESWQAFRAAIPWSIAMQQFNLLGSHDTERILALLGGDPALNRLAVALLMTYPGVPSVYYGDEVGLGSQLEQTRTTMPWDPQRWDHELHAYYQALVRLRRTSPALIHGGFQVLLAEGDILAFMRDAEEERLLIVANRGPGTHPAGGLPVADAAIANGAELVEFFSNRRATVTGGMLPLPALPPGAQIWRWRP